MKYLIANWKMSIYNAQIDQFFKDFKRSQFPLNITYGVSVPSVYLQKTALTLKKNGWLAGGQNVAFAESGAYTGENSAKMLKEVGADFCLVGHSERRTYFNEDNQTINKKINRLLNNDIKPLLCIGETLQEYENKQTKKVLLKQLKECLCDIKDVSNIIIAYEPVWAIGTGKTASVKDIKTNIQYIKQVLQKMFGKTVSVLYGGSVKPGMSADIFKIDCVDGALVGGASLNCADFLGIAKDM